MFTVDGDRLAHAQAAVELAAAKYPQLEPRGFPPFSSPYELDQHAFSEECGLAQIATAIDFLRSTDHARLRRMTSYELKAVAEDWGRKNGLAPYVSNGAMIVAALYAGLTVEPLIGSANARFA